MIARIRGHETTVKPKDSFGVKVIKYNYETEELQLELDNHGRPQMVHHQPVPQRVFEELQKAPSKGGYYNSDIRDKYPFVGTD